MSSVPPNNPAYPPGTPMPPQQVIVQPTAREMAAEQRAEAREEAREERAREVVVMYSHSNFFYWWPVWAVGYVMAILSRLPSAGAHQVDIGGGRLEWFNPSKDLGVVFTVTFFLVILITNVMVRGVSSLVVILGVILGVVLVLYFGWWEQLAVWFNLVSIHMNMGFYVCFSTLIFIVWAVLTFGYDRLSYWRVTPGQITQEFLIGGASKSFDTRGMVFEKHRNDLFRHWILGFGSGDVHISTTGAKKESIAVPNVLFVDSKVAAIQEMIAMRPDQFAAPAM